MPTSLIRFESILILSALISTSLHAAPVLMDSSLSLNQFIDNENGANDDDNFTMVLERLRLKSSSDGVAAGLRVDGMFFLGDKGPRKTEARLERVYADIERDNIRIVAGDFYKQLGRGLLLALRKVDEVGFDVVLRGVDTSVEKDAFKANLFAGFTNSVNIDNLKNKFVEDPEDILAGGDLKGEIKDVTIGAHAVHRRNSLNVGPSRYQDSSNSVGAYSTSSFFEGLLSLYIEGALQQTRLADQVNTGHAAYSTIDLIVGDVITTLEAIELSEFTQNGSRRDIKGQAGDAIRYNQVPTLERIDQETSKGIDERATRLMLQYSTLDGDLTFSTSGLFKIEFPDQASELTTFHGFGGFDYTYDLGRSRIAASGGYRDLGRTGDGSFESFKQMEHSEFTYLQHLVGRTSLRIASMMEYRTLEDRDYVRGSNFIGVENGRLGSFTFEYGLDNVNTQPGIRNHFFAGIISANVSKGLVVKSTVGTQRGGLKCVAGICRDYPSFAGGRVDILFTKYL